MGMVFRGPHRVRKSAVAAKRQVPVLQLAGRAGLSLALMAGFVWMLGERWAQIDGAALTTAFSQLGPDQWITALGFTALSFWAVGRYDAVLHRHFATGVPARSARRAGICAISVSQTIGLGLVSGAILRWRMLPETSLWQATRLTAAVALSFLAGWAVVTSAVLIALPDAPYRLWAALVLIAAAGLSLLSICGPRIPGLSFRWPNGFTLSRLVGLCAVDTLAAALAFHALQPEGLALPFATLLPAFLLALGAGLALGTPGGMGAFEVTLIALLPAGENPEFLAAVLAWRLVYYALPALAGAAVAILGPAKPAMALDLPARYLTADCAEGPPAEAGLCRQGELTPLVLAGQVWVAGRRHHSLISLFDPIGARCSRSLDLALKGLRKKARAEGCMPVSYKASARLAARGRKMGHTVRRIGWEAWIAPAEYRIAASSRSGLRRKLRRAEAAGVIARYCPPEHAPWRVLDQLAQEWANAHGGERGFSMGRHDRTYLTGQRLYVAWQGDDAIAYASFHVASGEWALDLMRHKANPPDGTMHSLIEAALEDAIRAKVPRFSLAAVPDGAIGQGDVATRLIAVFAPETAATGLLRFKSAFAPKWKPLYLLAPGRAGLLLAALSLWRAITRPRGLVADDLPEIERNDEEYAFASGTSPWHIEAKR